MSMLTPEDINDMLALHWPLITTTCTELSETMALASMKPDQAALRPGGFISGPTQFAVADAAFWFMVSGALGRLEPMALTSELSIRYLRPAQGTVLYARAELERLGRRQAVATIRIWTDDQESNPCAVAQGTYALPR